MSGFSVTSLGMKYLNSLGGRPGIFEVYCWYIILGFFQLFPGFYFRFRLSFLSFSVQLIPYGLCYIRVWTLGRPIHDFQCCINSLDLTALAVCLEYLLCWIIKLLSIRRLPEGMAWWVQICVYFSALVIPSIWPISPTPLAEVEPQTRTLHRLPPRAASFHSSVSPTLLTCSSIHNTLLHWSSFQSLWAVAFLSLFILFSFPEKWFPSCYGTTLEGSTCLPDEAAGSWCRSLLNFVRPLRDKTLRNLSSFGHFSFLPVLLLSLNSPDSLYFFIRAWISHLESIQCVYRFPFESELADAKLRFYVLLNSDIFGILNGRMWFKVSLNIKLPKS